MLEDVSIAKSLELAVATETQAEAAYEMLAKQFADHADLKALFERFADDEREHRRQFLDLLRRVPPDEAELAEHEYVYLHAMSIWDFFGEGEPLDEIENMQDKHEILRKVFYFERTTLGYYRAIADVLGPNEALDRIIQAEKAHVVKIVKLLHAGG